MTTLTYALPVFPDKAERVRGFQAELEPHRRAYDELNRQATISHHEMYLQRSDELGRRETPP